MVKSMVICCTTKPTTFGDCAHTQIVLGTGLDEASEVPGKAKSGKNGRFFHLALLTHLVLEVELNTLDGSGDGL